MKKIVLSVVALMALGTAAQAQEDMSFGVKAGVNFANFGGDDAGDASMRTGFHVGAIAEFKLSETFAIQPELLYSMQGAETETSFGDVQNVGPMVMTTTTKAEVKQKLNYLNIPILAKYYITEGLSVHAGPQIGFLLSAEAEESGSTTVTTTGMGGESSSTESYEATTDNKDAFKGIDFGIAAGVGYDLPMGLFFNARYNLGLSKIGEDVTFEGETIKAASVNNNVIQISVGYKF